MNDVRRDPQRAWEVFVCSRRNWKLWAYWLKNYAPDFRRMS